jgi:3-oxoacyl-[acyl-carrier protein] reductase
MSAEPSDPKRAPPVTLITGAAGGLGQALVERFALEGWRVAAGWYRRPCAASGPNVAPVELDVTSPASVTAAVDAVTRNWGRLDALVHNAGVRADRLVAQMSGAEWDRVMAVHLRGAFLCARAVLPVMLARGTGHILHVASLSARSGHFGQANYAAAKAGLIGLTQALAREAGPGNVRVNAILPGVLRTPMTEALTAPQFDALARENVLGRLSDPGEVARCVVFLASLQHVSGQVFALDSRIGRWT